MNYRATLFPVILSCTAVLGCLNSGPKCGDADVKKLVTDISMTEFRNQLTNVGIMQEMGQAPATLGNPTFEQLKQYRGKSDGVDKVIAFVEEQANALELQLIGVRTNGINKDAKSCDCGGTLKTSNGTQFQIRFTAQATEDGTYVEVHGLK